MQQASPPLTETPLKVGVVGAGVMGRGVAQALAQAGQTTILVDVSQPILDEARNAIGQALKMASLFDPALRVQDHSAILQRVMTSTDYADLSDVDFVIENTTEEWRTKACVYPLLDRFCPPAVVLAANTSAIPIARIAASVAEPARVIGMHFMNPVPQKKIVEVIAGPETGQATIETAKSLLQRLGKRAILVRDSPGFVTNRVLMLTINEAIAVVEEGIADAAAVDEIFVGCFAHSTGPLATADLIGLDTILRSLKVLREEFDDPKYDPAPLLVGMVKAGRLGRKSGSGFFDYRVKAAR